MASRRLRLTDLIQLDVPQTFTDIVGRPKKDISYGSNYLVDNETNFQITTQITLI